jgi:nucleotide-binding universal stress UspA family protein
MAEALMSTKGKLVIVGGVAWDETADPLWTEAERLLRASSETTLRLVHVLGLEALRAETDKLSAVDDALKRMHEWVLAKTGTKDSPLAGQIHLEVAMGNPADEIVQVAVDNSADLILLGTHGRTGVAKLVLGSVAEQVLHRSPCSVFIARPADFEGRDRSPAIEPSPEAGHRPFRPHPPRYHSSVTFSSYDANLIPTGISRKTVH